MPKGELIINGYDAYERWGMSMDNTSLSAIMTPAGMKSNVKTKSRISHGSVVSISNPKVEERNVNVNFQITAKNTDIFFERYMSFCEELERGLLIVKTKYQPNVFYRFEYKQCSQFSQFIREMAKFTLKLVEPNPKERGEVELTSDEFSFNAKSGSTNISISYGGTKKITDSRIAQKLEGGCVVTIKPNYLVGGVNAKPDVCIIVERTTMPIQERFVTYYPESYENGEYVFNMPLLVGTIEVYTVKADFGNIHKQSTFGLSYTMPMAGM